MPAVSTARDDVRVIPLSDSDRLEFEALHTDIAQTEAGALTLTSFWPMVGAAYDGELLIVGRAVNGWRTDWQVDEVRSPEKVAAIVAAAIATNTEVRAALK